MIRLGWTIRAESLPETAVVREAMAAADLAGLELLIDDVDSVQSHAQELAGETVTIIGIAGSLTVPAPLRADSAWLDPARRWIMAAAEIGCAQVRLSLHAPTYRPSINRLAEQLHSLAELAEEISARVIVDAVGPFQHPRDLWTLLELCASENLFAGILVGSVAPRTGETGATLLENAAAVLETTARRCAALSIPLLNRRIRHVVISEFDPTAPLPRAVESAVHHLLGIGYDGWMMLRSPPERLQPSAALLRTLVTPIPAGK